MATVKLRQLWKNEYFQTIITVLLVVVIVFGFWYSFQLALNTQYPALAVVSGSMCRVQDGRCDGWSHPFAPTLHKGDLIIVQGINPKALRVGDIIVYHRPLFSSSDPGELIVHRIIEVENNTTNGLVYFETKGDANSGPDPFDYDYRGTDYAWHGKISENLVVGRVIMRIPWIGHMAILMRNTFGIFIIAILIIIILIIEFAFPSSKPEEEEHKPEENEEKTSEPTTS